MIEQTGDYLRNYSVYSIKATTNQLEQACKIKTFGYPCLDLHLYLQPLHGVT